MKSTSPDSTRTKGTPPKAPGAKAHRLPQDASGSGTHPTVPPALRIVLVGLALVLLTFSAYGPVVDNGFVSFDDADYITENAVIQRGLSLEGLRWAFASPQVYNWHPLTWLSHMLDVELFGLNATGHHLMSLVLHAANAVLLFLVLHAMTGALGRSAAVAALFALHPLHVESVAWASERKDVLSTLFWLLALGAYVGYVKRPSLRRYGVLFLCFALSLLAKQMAVTLPFLLLLLDYWPLGRFGGAAAAPMQTPRKGGPAPPEADAAPAGRPSGQRLLPLVRGKIPLFLLAGAASVTIYLIQTQTGITKSLAQFPLATRLANAIVSYGAYLVKTFCPLNLAVFYPHPGTALPLGQVALSGAAMGLVTVLVLRSRRPYLALGWFWYLGTLVPVIGLIQVGLQGMADRYTYVPLIGIFIMVAWGLTDLVSRWRLGKRVLAASAVALLVPLMILTWRQAGTWQSDLTLYGRAVEATQANYWAEHNLGRALLMAGRDDEALPHLQTSIRLEPTYPEAYLHLGLLDIRKGRPEEAAEHFRKVLELDPGHDKALRNLSFLLLQRGGFAEAADHLRTLRRARPEDAEAWFLTGLLEARRGDATVAEAAYEKALQIRPDYPEAHTNLGILLARQGRLREAVAHFRETTRLRPGDPHAQRNLEAALREADRSR